MKEKKNKYAFSGFSKLNLSERIKTLRASHIISKKDVDLLLSQKQFSSSLGENLIENFLGYFQLPLGIAVNFNIDNVDYVIPMVIEETSVIAAASKTAKWIKENGKIETTTKGNLSIGQIQIAKTSNFKLCENKINANKAKLISSANKKIAKGLVKRGGGLKELFIRRLARDDQTDMAIVHILIDTCDAMGANIINQICEYLARDIELLTGESVNLSILSNLNDTKLTQAKVLINHIDPKIGEAIAEASLFAEKDPYRAATNNKGVLNGMDAVAIATGNDWRALEAGIHAFAARNGQYSSITKWKYEKKQLIGELIAPINVGIVGGVISIHPTASICLKILNIKKASDLARIIAAVGLVQNLGALRALTTEGIVNGHMRLHINNLCLAAKANANEIAILKKNLQEHLKKYRHITLNDAITNLRRIRSTKKRKGK